MPHPRKPKPGETVIIRAHGVPKRVQEKLAGSGANVLDATCPFVKKIHTIVKNETEKGRRIIIFGSPAHPEVEAIASFCDDPVIVQSPEEIENWLAEDAFAPEFTPQHGQPDDERTENVGKLRKNRKKRVYKLRNI